MNPKKLANVGSVGAVMTTFTTAVVAQVGETSGGNSPYYHGHDMMWSGSQWGGFGMVLGPIFMILILIAIIAGVIYVLRIFGGPGVVRGGDPANGRALSILKERYAKGEIDTKEFEERKKMLSD